MMAAAIIFVSQARLTTSAGRALAAEHCTRCHVVGDINPYGGIESTLSFIGMKYLADWERRFEEFYILPPTRHWCGLPMSARRPAPPSFRKSF